MKLGLGLASVGLALALALPAAASASVVDLVPGPVFPEDQDPSGEYTAVYVGSSDESNGLGENNHLTVTFGSTGTSDKFTFHDTGAHVHARLGCVQVDVHTATCSDADGIHIDAVQAELGYGNDTFHTVHPQGFGLWPVQVDGGPNDDVLTGGPESDDMNGGGGHDHLLGGGGNDTLNDGDRDGAINGTAPGHDVLDGGTGDDTLSYAGRKRGVKVDLASGAPTGEKGEKDTARGFESATGGSGNDKLYGNDGGNTLMGGAGDDVLLGRGGEDPSLDYTDLLYGGSGRDRLAGGAGPDYLDPGPGLDHRLSCDGGSDEVFRPAAGEVIGHCEQVAFRGHNGDGDMNLLFDPHPSAVTRKRVEFGFGCPTDSEGELMPCNFTAEMREAFGKHRLLGKAHFKADLGQGGGPVSIRLTRLGRKLIARRAGVMATTRLRNYPISGVAWTVPVTR